MPHGFFTIEEWKQPQKGAPRQWIAVRHLDGKQSLSAAMKELEGLGRPGFFRVVQTQRMVWVEKKGDRLRLRKWHANSPESLARSAEAFVRDKGVWPDAPKPVKTSGKPAAGRNVSNRRKK